jgi:tetratricopeptide (TPR) repeat protein
MNSWSFALCAAAVAATAAAPARADGLRNVIRGQAIPEFSLTTLDGEPVGSAELAGKAVILVYLSAEQRRSELAATAAAAVWRELDHEHRDALSLVFVTPDADRASYFRRQREVLGVREPLALDVDRQLYGDLGLIVLPTTIVVDPQWRLAHVISSYKSDYDHVLQAYAEHAMGRLDDEGLQRRLTTRRVERNRPEDLIARHRAAARIMRGSGLPADAQRELQAALEIDPAHADTRLDLAAVLVTVGRTDEAGVIVAEVLESAPGHRRARLIHGVVLYHDGSLDEAEAVLKEVLLLNPDPVQTHYYLGLIYERKGDPARAAEHFKQSLTRLLRDRSL